MRDELFPFWEGKSVDEYCESQYREAGVWELSGESFVSDCSYHAVNGGGDSNPGYDVILMKKGMIDIQNEAKEHLAMLTTKTRMIWTRSISINPLLTRQKVL